MQRVLNIIIMVLTDEELLANVSKCCKPKTAAQHQKEARLLGRILGQPLWRIMHSPTSSYAKLKRAYPNITTLKNKVSTVCKMFTASSHEDADERRQWQELLKALADEQLTAVKTNQMPEKYADRIVDVDEVRTKANELASMKPSDADRTLAGSLQRLLIVLLADIRPKRSDLGHVPIVSTMEECKDTDKNYVVLPDDVKQQAVLVMQRYKTDRHFGRVTEAFTARATRVLRESLKAWPRSHLFVDSRKREPYTSNDIYGQFVARTFSNMFDKKVGTALWRHIYASQAIDANQPEAEREEIARLMLHSTTQNLRYRWVTQKKQ